MGRENAKRGWLKGAAVGAAVGLLAVACSFSTNRPLVVAFDERIATLDPQLHNHSATWSVQLNIFDSLVRFSPEMRLEPCLATQWEQLDATHWRFYLRRGVRFSDGTAFDAEDVVATFDRARRHPRSRIQHVIAGIRSVRAEAADVVLVETTNAAPDLLNRLVLFLIVPSEAASLAEITQPVGTGPYRLVQVFDNGDLLLGAWKSWRGWASVRSVRLCFAADESAAARQFLSGAADVVRRPPDEMVVEIEKQQRLRLVPQPRLGVQLLVVIPNARSGEAGGALASPAVRRAMLLALDRPGWVGRYYRGNGTVASQYVHPVVFGFDPTIRPLPFDPTEARRLLAAAGYGKGFAAKMVYRSLQSGAVEGVVKDLAQVGIRITPILTGYAEASQVVRSGEADLYLTGWACNTGDASDFFNTMIHSPDPARGVGMENYTGFADEGIDRLLDGAERELVVERRSHLLQEAQRRTLEQLPILPLTIRWGFVGTSAEVEVRTRHDERMWFFDYRWRR